MTTRHPLPWTMPGRDSIHLEPAACVHDGQPKPYKLRLGPPPGWRPGSTSYSAVFTEDELRSLRDQIDAVLAAPYRVLILGGEEIEDSPALAALIHARLDQVHTHHPRMEVSTRCMFNAADEAAEQWCTAAEVPVWFYGDVASMVEDGGSRALVVLRPGDWDGPNWDEGQAADAAGICVSRLEVASTPVATP